MDQIEDFMKSKRIQSRTQAIQYLIRIGLKMDEFKVKCSDPEFVKEMDNEWKVEETADWIDSLSYQQKEIIGRAWEIAKRKRERELNQMIH